MIALHIDIWFYMNSNQLPFLYFVYL